MKTMLLFKDTWCSDSSSAFAKGLRLSHALKLTYGLSAIKDRWKERVE